jgi:putative flippase GtrA
MSGGASATAPHPAPRFLLVGASNFFVSLAVFYLCYHLLLAGGVPALRNQAPGPAAIANVVAYLAGMVNSFLWNRSWTFRARDGRIVPQALRFAVVNFVSLALGTVAMYLLVDRRGVPELAVWMPLAVVITLLNYYGSKLWAFARRPSPTEQSA